jgi:hypothetical protein
MGRINLGSYEFSDSSGLLFECDITIPKVSKIPDILIHFRDELMANSDKLAGDTAVAKSLTDFLKSKGYEGQPPIRISKYDSQSLLGEVDLDFIDFALSMGWVDLTENEEAGAKESLISILESEDQTVGLITLDTKNIFITGGSRYLVLGFEEMSKVVCAGILENLNRIDSGLLAGHCSRKLSESYEERCSLIEAQKQADNSREDFNEWIKNFLISDSSFFSFIATSLTNDEIYDIAFGGRLVGKTENHVVFELAA